MTPSDDLSRNRIAWDAKAADYATRAVPAGQHAAPRWGQLGIPESSVHALPPSVAGLDVIELGCGTRCRPARHSWSSPKSPGPAI